jgi:hypothetical protein
MTVNGVPQVDIARAMQLDPKTLRKFYRESLDHGTIILCARVARNLGKIATTGRGAAAVSACRYILGCRANWKDTAHIEVGPRAAAMDYFGSQAESADVREIIAARLAIMAATREKLQ